MEKKNYESPFSSIYASQEMREAFSPYFKFKTWRKLWTVLAEAEKELGLPITEEQIEELGEHIGLIDFEKITQYEKAFGHEISAHLHEFGDRCTKAKSVIHLGATSSYITENSDLVQMLYAMKLLRGKCILLIEKMNHLALEYAGIPCLGYAHFQPSHATSLGKRIALWLQDFLFDFQQLHRLTENLPFLGTKGALGSQASFLALFENDQDKVDQLDSIVTQKMGFNASLLLSSDTFPRKIDQRILATLTGIAASIHKCATDLRLLAQFNEIEEPLITPITAPHHPYKRNPLLSEKICGLARFVMNLSANATQSTSLQWLEHSFDDSSNRRLTIPEAFLATDSILTLLYNLFDGLTFFPKMMEVHLNEHLPYLAIEHITAGATLKGKKRDSVYTKLHRLCFEASREKKETGKTPDLMTRIAKDPEIGLSQKELLSLLKPQTLMGRAKEQTIAFLKLEVQPILAKYLTFSITNPEINY